MNFAIQIKDIPASSTYAVRQPVLRPGRPLEECIFQGDTSETTFHLGSFLNDHLIGVASFMKISNPLFNTSNQYQLRGMAILPQHKGKGYGAKLLQEGEKRLKSKTSSPLLWFNARVYATGFYTKFGYRTIGEKFNIPGVCDHIVMHKQL